MPIDVRATGALILLFGLQAQRIRHLCAEHVVAQDDNTYLTTGEHPILLSPRLGAIIGELADRPSTRLMIHHGTDAPRWLLPGRVPGQPIDNHSLTNRLNRHGISARLARNGALMALAADLPAPAAQRRGNSLSAVVLSVLSVELNAQHRHTGGGRPRLRAGRLRSVGCPERCRSRRPSRHQAERQVHRPGDCRLR
jgi:hypothetical protein